MKRLWVRLSLAFSMVVLVGVVMIALMAILLAHTGARQFFLVSQLQAPGGLVDELANYHQTHHSWDGVETLLRGARAVVPLGAGEHVVFSLADADGRIVHSTRSEGVGRRLSQSERAETLPIRVTEGVTQGHETVGYIHLKLAPAPRLTPGRRYPLEWLSRTLLLIAAAGGALGILFGVLISRNLTAPLRRLAEGARTLDARDLSHRVEVSGSDEIVEVARAFNAMAAALEQAQTLRRNMMADAAHELRTPLSVLQGNLRAILDDVYALDKAEVARLYEETRLLSRLVEDLHELALAEAGQFQLNRQPTDLADLVQASAAAFGPAAKAKGVILHPQVPADLPSALADPARLTQVLHNLMANALRHTPAGGTISLRAYLEHKEGQEDHLCLEVGDTGEGISPKDMPYIFDRFYRADRARSRSTGGAGLGLAIVRAIVEAHGGQVSAASEGVPGQGSTFTVRLPL